MEMILSGICLVIQPVSMLIYLYSLHDLSGRKRATEISVQENDDGTARDDLRASEPRDEVVDSGNNADISRRKLGIDRFNNEESDPAKSNAMSKFHISFFY